MFCPNKQCSFEPQISFQNVSLSPNNRMSCFVLINSVRLKLLCVSLDLVSECQQSFVFQTVAVGSVTAAKG